MKKDTERPVLFLASLFKAAEARFKRQLKTGRRRYSARSVYRLALLPLLAALPVSANPVMFAWDDNSASETGFKVERAPSGGSFVQIGMVGTNVTSYTDATALPSTTYSYRVRASNGSIDTAYTNVLTVTSAGAQNTAPTISNISDRTLSAGSSSGPIGLTVSDSETSAGSLALSGRSSNTTLVPDSAIVFGGSGSSRTVTVTPAAGQSGSATITLTVSDGALTASAAFTLSVTASNTAPTISTIASQTIGAGTSTGPIAVTIGDAQTSAASLTLAGSSSNTTLVPTANIAFGGSGSDRTVTVTPDPRRTGSATITVTVSDGSLSANRSFTVNVLASGDTPPTISSIADHSVDAGKSTGPIAFTISDVQTAASSLTLARSSSNTTLVPVANIVFGGSGSNRTVAVTPAAGQFGTATITVTVSDGSASTNASFVLTVKAAPAGGLVAAYGFNETSGTSVTDASGNTNHGVIQGAARVTTGKFGAALNFDGASNLVAVKSSPSLSLSQAMTLEAWVYPTATQSGWRTLLQKSDSYFLHASGSNALQPEGGVVYNNVGAQVASSAAIAVNVWTHVALTYDGSNLHLYLNGALVSSLAQTGAIGSNANDLYIGGNNPYGEYFRGLIDEVRIYNRALTVSEIQSDMQMPVSTAIAPTATWGGSDIGNVGVAGSDDADATNAKITIRGSGVDIWDSADSFRFVYRTLRGDGVVEARVESISDTNEWAKAGVMIRSSLAANAANAMVLVRPSNQVCAQARGTNGGGSSTVFGPSGSATGYWVRLERKGNSLIASTSTNGVKWTRLTTFSIPMGEEVYAGFAVTSHNNSVLATGVFSEPYIR